MSEQYYAALTRPNIQLHSSHIDKIVDQTIYSKDGKKEEVDVSVKVRTKSRYRDGNVHRILPLQVLILATGFKVHDYFSPMQVYGKGGEDILRSWIDKEPRSFYGIALSSTPNLFVLLGPNTVRCLPKKPVRQPTINKTFRSKREMIRDGVASAVR